MSDLELTSRCAVFADITVVVSSRVTDIQSAPMNKRTNNNSFSRNTHITSRSTQVTVELDVGVSTKANERRRISLYNSIIPHTQIQGTDKTFAYPRQRFPAFSFGPNLSPEQGAKGIQNPNQCNTTYPTRVPFGKPSILTSVFYNLADQLAVLDIAPQLFWQRVLCVVVLGGKIDVDAAALACEDFSG